MQNFPYLRQPGMPDRSRNDIVKTNIADIDTIETGVVVGTGISTLDTVKVNAADSSRGFQRPNVIDILLFLVSLLALFLWSISLQVISLNDLNDLGLISALSPRIIAALGILVVSFALTLQRREVRVSLLAFQLICIILILYGTQTFIEETH